MKISVVITHFNRIDLLRRAVESVLNQTHAPHEILLIDDCTPGLEIDAIQARLPCDRRIRIYRTPRNSGAQVARNLGIDLAEGEFIALMDSDDEWIPSKLAMQLLLLQSTNSDLCACDVAIQYQGQPTQRRILRPRFNGDPIRFIANMGGHMQTSTLLVRAAVAKTLRFDESVKKYQDWDFVFRFHLNGYRSCYLDNALSVYHFGHADQMTSIPKPDLALSFFQKRRSLLGDDVYFRALVVIVARMYAEIGNWRAAAQLIVLSTKSLKRPFLFASIKVLRKYLIYFLNKHKAG